MKEKYRDTELDLLVGFETEYIAPHTIENINSLVLKYDFDFIVGSIHHVKGIPIDYNRQKWNEAADACGSLEKLFETYFDEQLILIDAIRPAVIGHFDVIRLWAPDPLVQLQKWPKVWEKIKRNIKLVVSYGGIFELNSAALRKGFNEPYPTEEIAKV